MQSFAAKTSVSWSDVGERITVEGTTEGRHANFSAELGAKPVESASRKEGQILRAPALFTVSSFLDCSCLPVTYKQLKRAPWTSFHMLINTC